MDFRNHHCFSFHSIVVWMRILRLYDSFVWKVFHTFYLSYCKHMTIDQTRFYFYFSVAFILKRKIQAKVFWCVRVYTVSMCKMWKYLFVKLPTLIKFNLYNSINLLWKNGKQSFFMMWERIHISCGTWAFSSKTRNNNSEQLDFSSRYNAIMVELPCWSIVEGV